MGNKMGDRSFFIAVCGFAGSGKNTVGEEVAKALGWKVVAPTFKDLAENEGISLMEFQEKAKKDLSIDYKFDAALARKIGAGGCVVVTWIGPWIRKISGKKYDGVEIPPVAPDVFSVWLDVPVEIRAKRLAGRDRMGFEQALSHIKKRDADNVNRYKKAYGINISEHSDFGLVVKVNAETPDELANKIIAKFKEGLK
jgi:CMP/dCMP kinase